MARRLQMPEAESMLRGWQTTTAYSLKVRLGQSDREQVGAFINTGHTAAMNVLTQMAQHMDTILAQFHQVADEEDAALRSK
jgi:hypothetical protein